jgi:hypothetical protein
MEHESRVYIDIETDDIAAEVVRLTNLGAKMVDRLERWVEGRITTRSGRPGRRVGFLVVDVGVVRRAKSGVRTPPFRVVQSKNTP